MKKQRMFQVIPLAVVLIIAALVAGCVSSPSAPANSTIPANTTVVPNTTLAQPPAIPAASLSPTMGPGGQGLKGGGMSAPDTSAIKQKWLDVPYANISSAEKMDIYLPNQGTGPFPVIVSIHGGGFISGDKASGELTPMLTGLNKSYAVVSINYRLSQEAQFPAQIQDVKAAIRFIRANAQVYNLNPEKIAVWGGSAGGNLAALAGTSGDVPELEDLSMGNPQQSSRVQAVVDWFGPINFLTMDNQFTKSGLGPVTHNQTDSPESQYLGAAIPTIPEKVKAANPETYISVDDPPFFIQHGTSDSQVPTEQSVDFAKGLETVIGTEKVTLETLQGAGHGDQAFTTTENVDRVFTFLDQRLSVTRTT